MWLLKPLPIRLPFVGSRSAGFFPSPAVRLDFRFQFASRGGESTLHLFKERKVDCFFLHNYRRLYQIFQPLARLILAIPAHYVHCISRDLCVWTGFRWRNTLDMCLHRVWRIISMWALFFRKQWVNQIPFECGTTLHNLRCWRCRCYMPKFSRWNWDYMLYIYMTS